MNAFTFTPRTAFNAAADMVRADAHMCVAMDALGDAVGALFDRRGHLSDRERRAEALIRDALIALSHARNLVEPLMTERGR